MSLSVAMNVLALSERDLLGSPLLAAKRFRQRTNVIAVMSHTISRWTARTTQHVNRSIQTLLLLFSPSLIYNVDGAGKVNGSVQKRWDFLDTERGKWW